MDRHMLSEYFQSSSTSRFILLIVILMQFGLTAAPIQKTTGLINAKYNNALSGKHNNALHGTINTNRLNIFTLILKNVLKILSLKNKVKYIVYPHKKKNLIYETNLTDIGFANSARKMILCPAFNFRLAKIIN